MNAGIGFRIIGAVISAAGVTFLCYALVGFSESDRGWTKVIGSLLLGSFGLLITGIGAVIDWLQRISDAAERNVNLNGAQLVKTAKD